MPLLDFLFGNEDVRKAMRDKSYLDPAGAANPEAARSAASRMELSSRLGKAALAVAQANQKGAGPGTILAAFGGGFGAGGDDFQAQQLKQAQIKNVLAQARTREAQGALGGLLKGPSGRVGKGADGMIYEVWHDGSTHVLPEKKMRGYTGQNVPDLATVVAEVRAATLAKLTPNQTVVGSTAGNPPAPGGRPADTAGLPRPATPEDAMKLPPGTKFVDPQGVVRVR